MLKLCLFLLCFFSHTQTPLPWRYNERDCVSNHQPHYCLLNRLFGHRSKKASKIRVTGLWVGNSPGTGEFPAQMASNAENVSIWWRHHESQRRLLAVVQNKLLHQVIPLLLRFNYRLIYPSQFNWCPSASNIMHSLTHWVFPNKCDNIG